MDTDYEDDDDDLGDVKEKRKRRFKNKNSRDKNRYGKLKVERLTSRPRQRINMSNFDLDEWEEWEEDCFDD